MRMTIAHVGALRVCSADRARRVELPEDGAVIDVPRAAASMAQLHELCTQMLQCMDSRLDVDDVLVDQIIDRLATVVRLIAQGEQSSDLIQRHVQGAAVANEPQPLDMFRPV